VRLNHLAKQSGSLSWSAAHNGSVVLSFSFESAGKEILGTYHGQINNARLFIYLTLLVEPHGEIHAVPPVSFSATINIEGVADFLEGPLRRRIRHAVENAANDALSEYADVLAQLVLANLTPPPPPDAFFEQIAITEGHASITWADSVKHADIVINTVDPIVAEPNETLRLSLSGGWQGGPAFGVSRFASPGMQLTLPLKLSGVALPDGKPFVLHVKVDSIDTQLPKLKSIGKIDRVFAAPGYGAGGHSDSNQGLTAGYQITIA
jgi:hypothetical protein